MTTILWFKRDLRLADHPAMALAARGPDSVLPLYIAEPDYWALPDTSARQWAFTAECLDELRADCARHGAPLIVRRGEAVAVLSALCTRHGISRIVSHEETGNGWTYARDLRVAAWARAAGVAWHEVPQSGVVRRLPGRDGWSARRDRFLRAAQAEPVAATGVPFADLEEAPGPIPSAADLSLAPDPCPGRQRGGRSAALALLGGFLTERGQGYRAAMSSPLDGEWACSRLSPHLALGTLSGREAAQATGARQREVRGTRDGWAGSLKSFQSRLAWRDHFMQKLEDAPSLEFRCLHSAYDGMRPDTPDTARLAAWCEGRTGLPFVDACMRFLDHTGWLNFRMRSMLMAVASYHLWLDWRVTGLHLARRFTDYEPGIHWSQVQMQSGTTGMNTVRIYNPVKQGHDQDPDGTFTRRWVPELAEVPDAFVHEPWRWSGAESLADQGYPPPIVDVKEAARTARERVWAVRKGGAFREEAARIVHKHASRKDSAGHFVNDRQPRRRRPAAQDDDRQGSFGF
ncbi:deoxyribodipyrimidine photolyase [Meridianimarinicoccus roseus]|uniref:Deoxyribodipyrimidine photolyase n=1 Tax=Meridianimarinicoccus roseus TaxID=2072018 RepID=A0A2V2LN87_9RHOB|nr:FAD-binding domain-containing protein [Meridianimarinicoccus roseus]PWR03183.1 deoxyribodipyrimidine photolyase [Meridianimarinicoccus roseus]